MDGQSGGGMLSPILIPVPMQHSMSQGDCVLPLYARKRRLSVEAPSNTSISACHHPGYLQPDGGLQNGMAHAAGRHSGGGCAALHVGIVGLPAGNQPTSTICSAAAL